MEHHLPTFTVRPKKLIYVLSFITFLLFVAHLFVVGHRSVFQLQDGIHTFDLDQEGNIPAFFSTCLFLINAALFFLLWKMKDCVDGSRNI
ncbi:hypothetical protein ACN4EG_19970 [Alkalinema pantanalense CENA528]|uniref:hypothetical protein n=1 Tax=Alkalinema pantanalense TaxID=1620705 RepID=UPI003D6FBA8D